MLERCNYVLCLWFEKNCLLKVFPGLLIVQESDEPEVEVIYSDYLNVLLRWVFNILALVCSLYFREWDEYLYKEK